MENEKRLIYANALMEKIEKSTASKAVKGVACVFVNDAPTVDAVEVDALKAWLYEIAMNNVDNFLCEACEEIISRLDGLRVFAREKG